MTKPTATTTTAEFSVDDILRKVAGDEAAELPIYNNKGDPTGIVFLVKSDQAPGVKEALTALGDGRRRKENMLAAQAQKARPGHEPFITVEEDAEFVRQAAVVRLAGWRGIKDEFSPATALKLLAGVPAWATQINQKAQELAGFTTDSAKL
ncbi:MAG TPA: hypothetical protein VEA44_10660 [Caulobacter sp.]|nr:hypothetical protein [Caulobacter sp.]